MITGKANSCRSLIPRFRGRGLWSIAITLLFFSSALSLDGGSRPLWRGSHYTEHQRDIAVERGLEFIYRVAKNPEYFADWGNDLLFCFYTISKTAKNEKLRRMAARMGRERALLWRKEHPDPPITDAESVYLFLLGAQAADGLLGNSDPALRKRVQDAANRFSVIDFLRFDPRQEPPPTDIPERCPKCNHQNSRGATFCVRCKSPLAFRSPYAIWLDALVTTYSADRYGVNLGASYSDVLKWIGKMRPYPAPADEDEFQSVTYAITHLVYTLNEYNTYRLSQAWLPDEFSYLKSHIAEAERYEDPEILGEFMDSLRAFGENDSAPEIRDAMEYLLARQNADGSWGSTDDSNIYARYHTTWTAIDGLRHYIYRGERLRIPELLPILLQAHQKNQAGP